MLNTFTGGGGKRRVVSFSTRCKNYASTKLPVGWALITTKVSKRKIAFTLAELLVTLGIIGVVSAMTVPTLMQNHQRKTYVTQLHKIYNEFSQAFIQYQTDHNAVNLSEAGLTSADKVSAFMKEYFKIVNDCGSKFRPCFAAEYRSLDGTEKRSYGNDSAPSSNTASCVVIASGASICLEPISSKYEDAENFLGGLITVDVNGQAGPNIGGRDAFFFRFYQDGSIDVYRESNACAGSTSSNCLSDIRQKRFEARCQKSAVGDDCIGALLNDNWEMNY